MNTKTVTPETTQKLYDLMFLKALCDCFPRKDNFREFDQTLRSQTLEIQAKFLDTAKKNCEKWVDLHFFYSVPLAFLKSRVEFKRKYSRKWNRQIISVSDGIISIDFVVAVPGPGKEMAVYHRIRKLPQ